MGHSSHGEPHDPLALDTIESTAPWRHHRAPRVPCLSIAWHPDPGRVGDVCLLDLPAEGERPRPVALSRVGPMFVRLAGAPVAPLGNPRVSRKPLLVTVVVDGSVTLDPGQTSTPVVLDGHQLESAAQLSAEDVARGVTIELARCILLVLHAVEPGLPRPAIDSFVGQSDVSARLRQEILRVGPSDVPVLLWGESGVGKDRVARAIHEVGRPGGHLVTAHMSELGPPQALLGACASGTQPARDGLFHQAEGGTLLLDGIEHASMDLQLMLLQAIEHRHVIRVGGHRRERVNARVIATSERDLRQAVEEGTFRRPLLDRLAGYEIALPPLRERREDIGLLLLHFLEDVLGPAGRLDLLGPAGPSDPLWLSAEQVGWLLRHSWPGNVRQLRHVARALAIGFQEDMVVPSGRLRALLEREPVAGPEPSPRGKPAPPRRKRPPREIPDDVLVDTLRRNRWEIAATARELGIARGSLYTRIERCPAIRQARDVPLGELRRALSEAGGDPDRAARQLEVSARALRKRLIQENLT